MFRPGADDVIGDRAYGTTPAKVAAVARAVTEGLEQAGLVSAILKHIAGHGRAMADSHERLPTVDTPESGLLEMRVLVRLRIAGDEGHQRRLDRAVDLDLGVAPAPVVLDCRAGRRFVVHLSLDRSAVRPAPSTSPASSTRGPTALPSSNCFFHAAGLDRSPDRRS